MNETSYPLHWPVTWKRTQRPTRARFNGRYGSPGWTIERARRELAAELERLGARDPILSTNLRLRLDGAPVSGQAQPTDLGVAVYFTLAGKRRVLACDRWDRVQHNIRAIALHVNAIRGQERWGVGSIEQAFTGYAALPERASVPSWHETLQIAEDQPLSEKLVQDRFRALVKIHHPDQGGSLAAFRVLCEARDDALKTLTATELTHV